MFRFSRGLRRRFVVAVGLLVLTTVTASAWTFVALSRLSGIVTDTVRQSESVTAVTSRLAGALEREDDAVLLILAGDARGSQVLKSERAIVDGALAELYDVLAPDDDVELARPLQTELAAYRRASDGVIPLASEREGLVQYHEKANPVLRRAVGLTTTIRDRHFELARRAVASGRDQSDAARRAVLLITLVALGIAVAIAWHLTRTVVLPVRRLTRGANAIRLGNFGERINVASGDELGELAAAFNQMAEDLAEFKRTNISEVVRAKETLEATLEALPDAVVLLDASGEIQSMNPAAVTTLASAGVHRPRHLDDLRLEGLDLSLLTTLAGTVNAASTDLTRALRVERDGVVQRLLPRVVPVPGPNLKCGGVILLLYDVTELVRLDEMRSELVAVASHELQTPLTTLRMTLLMLKETSSLLPAHQQELVATSLIGVEQLAETVHEFLDLTRIEAGELRLNFEPVHLPLLIADALRRIEAQAKSQLISVEFRFADDVPSIWGDPVRLRAVLSNVLSNALKYTPSGGAIVVDARLVPASDPANAGSVSLSVIDSGPGVPAAFRSQIFDKFFRVEHHLGDGRPHARGAGIGLYMCRQIVELHGGEIRCAAGPNGRGTCITVSFGAGLEPTNAVPSGSAIYVEQ